MSAEQLEALIHGAPRCAVCAVLATLARLAGSQVFQAPETHESACYGSKLPSISNSSARRGAGTEVIDLDCNCTLRCNTRTKRTTQRREMMSSNGAGARGGSSSAAGGGGAKRQKAKAIYSAVWDLRMKQCEVSKGDLNEVKV